MRRVGSGSIVLCTYPLEHMASITADVNPESTGVLYGALAAHAGVRRLITVSDPRVSADVLVREDGVHFAWLVSQADEPVTVQPQLAEGLVQRPLDGSADYGVGEAVTLAPFGIAVFRLEATEK